MELRILSKKTRGGLFIQFEFTELDESEADGLIMEPPGAAYRELLRMEEELRGSGAILDSPDTGFAERIEPMSDSSSCTGGYFEVPDEAGCDAVIDRLKAIFPRAEVDFEEL